MSKRISALLCIFYNVGMVIQLANLYSVQHKKQNLPVQDGAVTCCISRGLLGAERVIDHPVLIRI